MYNTRSKGKMDNTTPITTSESTGITTTTSMVMTTATTTTTTATTGTIPRRPGTHESSGEIRLEDVLESSHESTTGQSPIVTPPYSAISEQGIREAYRQRNEPLRPPTNNPLTHDDLRQLETRLMNLMPRVIQQTLSEHMRPNEYPVVNHVDNFRLPDLRQPPPVPANVPRPQLQLQPWSQNQFYSHNNVPSFYNENVRSGSDGRTSREQSRPPSSPNAVRVDKWGITFDGTSKSISIEDFVFRVETLQADFGCEWKDVLKSFHHLLSGPAREWFWDFRRFSNITRWIDLKAALITQFHRFDSDFDIQKKILDRRQNSQESFEDFYNAVIRLRNQLRFPLSERDLITIMRGNLKAQMAQLLFAVPSNSLAEFAKECRRAENLLNSQRHYSARYPPRAINMLETEPIEDEYVPEVDAMNINRTIICWNCREEGHLFVDCPEERRALFCFKCGLENTVTPRCPNCQGNRVVNVSRNGTEMRSRNNGPNIPQNRS